MLVVLALGAPTLSLSSNHPSWVWADTTLAVLSTHSQNTAHGTTQSLYQEKLIKGLTDRIERYTTATELIYCNYSYMAGLLSILTGRATTTQMVGELQDRSLQDKMTNAKLIIWLKDPTSDSSPEIQKLVAQYGLILLEETELAYLLRNPQATAQRTITKAVIPWWLTSLSILGVIVMVIYDLR